MKSAQSNPIYAIFIFLQYNKFACGMGGGGGDKIASKPWNNSVPNKTPFHPGHSNVCVHVSRLHLQCEYKINWTYIHIFASYIFHKVVPVSATRKSLLMRIAFFMRTWLSNASLDSRKLVIEWFGFVVNNYQEWRVTFSLRQTSIKNWSYTRIMLNSRLIYYSLKLTLMENL